MWVKKTLVLVKEVSNVSKITETIWGINSFLRYRNGCIRTIYEIDKIFKDIIPIIYYECSNSK